MLKIGYIGLGGRGRNMLKTILDSFKNVKLRVSAIYERNVHRRVLIWLRK